MLCGLRDCNNQAALYWELPDGHREYRCLAHEYHLVPQEAVRHDYHIVPGEEAAHQAAPTHDYRILPDGDA
jgi:hypothetical protein